jgi:hypothetical protein
VTKPRTPVDILKLLLDGGAWYPSAIELDIYGAIENGEVLRTEAEASVKTFEVTFKQLVSLLRESRQQHYHCSDSWFCCGACTCEDHGELDSHGGEADRTGGVCNCGASAWNARVDEALKDMS